MTYKNSFLEAIEEYLLYRREEEAKFRSMFHKGVVLKHVGSGINWTITEITTTSDDKKLAKITSNKGYSKTIDTRAYNSYIVLEVPKAVKVLYFEE